MFFNIKSNYFFSKVATGLIYIITFPFKFKKSKKNNDKIGIIVLHKLGDSVFTIPALKQIINYHKKNIFLICFSETIPIFKIVFSSINYIGLLHDDFLFNERVIKYKAKKKLKKLNFSTIYDLTGAINSATILYNYPAKEIIGINEIYYKTIYTKHSRIRSEPHITDIYLDAIKSTVPLKNFNDDQIIENIHGEYIIIHPFASLESKEWGLKKYIYLAEHLNKKYNCILVVPPQKISTDLLSELSIKKIKVIETQTIPELIEIIKKSFLLIGNDSGPVHIANLLGKSTFTIYGPTNPLFHKPLTGKNKYIIREIPCTPKSSEKLCFTCAGRIGCPSFECINNLSFNEVKKEVDEFIKTLEKQNTEIEV